MLGTTERWILRNSGGWDHTVHIHDVDQQLISRNGQPPTPDELTKESWYIGGGQEVEVKMKFTDHTGRYVFHCHVLEHEDDAMMGQFEVVAAPPPAGRRVRPSQGRHAAARPARTGLPPVRIRQPRARTAARVRLVWAARAGVGRADRGNA